MEAEFPAPFDHEVRIIDRYTVWDVSWMGLLVLIGWFLPFRFGAVTGLVLGLIFAELTPGGKRLDRHVVDAVRQITGSLTVARPQVSKIVEGSVLLEDNTVLGIVEVSSCSIEQIPESDRRANRDVVTEMLAGVDYPVEIYSRQRHVSLSDYPGTGDSAVATDHYVVVRTSASTVAEGHRTVADRSREVRDMMTAADLRAERLTGEQLESTVEQLYSGKKALSRTGYRVEHGQKTVCRTLYVSGFPEQLPFGWVADVLNAESPGLVDVVQSFYPFSNMDRSRMDRLLARTEAEISASRKPFRQAGLQKQKQDLEDLIDAEAGGEPLVNYGVCITVRGETGDEAEETLDAVKSVLDQYRVERKRPVLQMSQAVKTASPFHRDRLGKRRVVPGYSAASGFSFAAYDTVESGGITFGQTHKDKQHVVLDRFSWEAGHISVMGKVGSGKSYWTGMMLLRSARTYDDLEIYILDPKRRDYGDIVDALDGETVIIEDTDHDSIQNSVVRYTVRDPSKDNTEKLAETVRHIYREALNTDSKSLVVVDEAHRVITRGNTVCQNGLQAVSRLIRESKDYDIAATLVTQNADEFTRSNEGRNILRNIDCSLFFKQKGFENEVADFFRFSKEESGKLRRLKTGTGQSFSEALLRGPVNRRIRIDATDAEHRLLEDGILEPEAFKQSIQSQPSGLGKPEPEILEKETDGGQETDNAETAGSETVEDFSLTKVFSIVSKRPISLFEYGLVIGLPALVFLHLNGSLPVLPAGALPSTVIDLLAGGIAVLIAAEALWILVLSVESWITKPWR
ncbi:hypothetical protein Harman_41690 [Haloarcula mannanilytica]|uniref:Transfer complex protein n=1 Tax=Haloarcula mannanilytica TaxID=2509225 RepID=A0A4C2ENP7_9EURY|nr:hypothetical protein [Haloarcula mannanilytica]GCF16234.1 hypothetical protein Harman_41690 [Haloarcula mannanilytica]